MKYTRCYAMGDDGTYYEIGGLRTIQINTNDNEGTYDVDFAKKLTNEPLTFTFELDNRKDRTTWSKIFMSKREATEFRFQKKKKRGTMRRRRRERRANEQSRNL